MVCQVRAAHSTLSADRKILWQLLFAGRVITACIGLSAVVSATAEAEPRVSSNSIRTPDFDESISWYQDKLGFRLLGSQSLVAGRKAVLERSGFLLEISEADHILPHELEAMAAVPVTQVPVISLVVPDVDREVRRLGGAGVDILQPPQDELDGTYRTAQIRDNGRHRIELCEPLDDPAALTR